MIIRFRTRDGLFRVNVEPHTRFGSALQQVAKLPHISEISVSQQPSQKGEPVTGALDRTIEDLGLSHGDMLFLSYPATSTPQDDGGTVMDASSTAGSSKVSASTSASSTGSAISGSTAAEIFNSVKQLPIDDLLDKQDGKIKRPRDPKMCRHGEKGMCDYCMPLEPFDQGYQDEHKIKHLSFHAYLKKLNANSNKSASSTASTASSGSSYMSPIAEPFFGVRKKCPSGHAPWPQGICSKCQPSAITLQQQPFRMVDHVEFADSSIVDCFIQLWRQTGAQRIGYLYGKYEPYTEVPLGVKAVVEAIFEPPQEDEIDGVKLTLPWPEEPLVDKAAALCGLQRVGVIYTDLLDAGNGDGSVVCKRHVDSYFLSSLEIAFAAQLQSQAPTPCRWSDSGAFSSKFVTCVVSGNVDSQVDIASYQVSANAEALLSADLIEPSTNPSVMRIKEPTKMRYVPDIFYKRINEYKLTVQENAKPAFPVEYLLVTLTHGFPDKPSPVFLSKPGVFPIENRPHVGELQDFSAIATQLKIDKSEGDESTQVGLVSDFHLLVYVLGLGILAADEERLLANLCISHELQDAYKLLESPGWQTLLTIIREST